MKIDDYRVLLNQRFEKYFDLSDNSICHGKKYDMSASYRARETQTVLFKENVMDFYDSKEICLVSFNADPSFIRTELIELPELTLKYTEPSRHHKSTVITRVFVTEAPEKDAVKLIKRFRFSKSFRFYFWGYAESKTVLVDLVSGKVYTNPAGRQEKKIFVPALNGHKS
ncbi:MAG: hypothetical protein M0P01_07360 [Treponema sp.]|nr:hypothetical protein [Treponema sp.]